MDYITINSIKVPIEGEKNVLSLIRKAGIDIPTFCYHQNYPFMAHVVCAW